MKHLNWQKQLQSHGIEIKRLIPLREWSESRVIRVEGIRCGQPVIYFLKRSNRNIEIESTIYRFATHHAEFPAPKANVMTVDGEVWLLLNQAPGNRLADIREPDTYDAYISAARSLAKFHMQAAASGWPDRLSVLKPLKDRLKTLPAIVLKELRQKLVNGEYTGIDVSLINLVEAATETQWYRITKEFGRYPDSLIHGDCHYGNLFLAQTGEMYLIDWSSASIAPGLMDLTALADVSQRMNAPTPPEPELLNAYLGEHAKSEREKYGNPLRAWMICHSVRNFLELEWFNSTSENYGERIQRELINLKRFLVRSE